MTLLEKAADAQRFAECNLYGGGLDGDKWISPEEWSAIQRALKTQAAVDWLADHAGDGRIVYYRTVHNVVRWNVDADRGFNGAGASIPEAVDSLRAKLESTQTEAT